jgi:hypothetical protein
VSHLTTWRQARDQGELALGERVTRLCSDVLTPPKMPGLQRVLAGGLIADLRIVVTVGGC